MKPEDLDQMVFRLLATAPDGMTAKELINELPVTTSQPTLSRAISRLRERGNVVAQGKARATRYLALLRTDDRARIRSRLLHRRIARRIARQPGLLEIARDRLAFLRSVNPNGKVWHDRWATLLDDPKLLRVMCDASSDADQLRKESPFTVLATPGDREAVFESLP